MKHSSPDLCSIARQAADTCGRCEEFRMFNPLRVEVLITQLNDSNRNCQRRAMHTLLMLGPLALGKLVQVIETGDEDMALSAAAIIVKIGPCANDALVEFLKTPPSLRSQRIVIHILEHIGDWRAYEVLLSILMTGDSSLTEVTIDALFNIGARRLPGLMGKAN
jgi:hypothetical protein